MSLSPDGPVGAMTDAPRRSVLKAAGTTVGTALLTSAGVSVAAQSGDDAGDDDSGSDESYTWPMYRGGPARTGFSEAADVGPSATRRFYVGDNNDPSTPKELSVGGGRVYLTGMVDDVTGANEFRAFDAETGEREWTYEPPRRDGAGGSPEEGLGDVRDPPAVGDGTVYVASTAHNNDGEWAYGGLFAFDAETGEVEWTHRDTFHWRNPILAGETLVAQDLRNDRVAAVDAETGEREWAVELDLTESSLLAVRDDTVYARLEGPDGGSLGGLSIADGSLQWKYDLPPDVDADQRRGESTSVSVGEDAIYYATRTEDENAVVAQSLEDGSRLWNRSLTELCGDPRPHLSAPVLAGGSIYVSTTADRSAGNLASPSTLWALDAESGDERWKLHSSHHLLGSPTATQGTVYVGTDAPLTADASRKYYDTEPTGEYPTVAAVDAADGTVQWAYAEPPENGGEDELYALTPVVTDRGLYVKTTGDHLDSASRILALESSDTDVGPDHRPQDL